MSIASALFTDSQAKVLQWLFGQPERSYHLSELRRLCGLGSASLQREVNRLVDAGLVLSERVGNLRRFQANAASPVHTELVALVRKALGAPALLREALAPLAKRLTQAYVFGSVARQADTADSDLDLMLVGDDLALADVLALVLPLEPLLGRKVNPTIYTPSQYAQRLAEPDSFVRRVLEQPVLELLPLGGIQEAP